MTEQPENLIKRPDGSYVDLETLPARKKLAHDLVDTWFPKAVEHNEKLVLLKKFVLAEMRAYRDMMMADYGVKVGGPEGGFSLKTVDGTRKIQLAIDKQTRLDPELDAAKGLIDEFLDSKLEGSSEEIREIVTKVFKLNTKGRLDTAGILGLRDYRFTDPLWLRAMDAIDDAIIRDSSTTYLRFYTVDTERKSEDQVPLNLAKV